MKNMFLPIVLLLALTAVPALAGDGNDQGQNQQGGGGGGGKVHGAPGPLLGAGLPILLVGGGIYWLVRRKKKASADWSSNETWKWHSKSFAYLFWCRSEPW
jgi:LPXTG-motif cell wall-anchored protein